jgi:ATP-dependent helicase/nuclease subunit B
MPRGAVVLPGLDMAMADDVFRRLQEPGDDATLRGHPQYGLARLLARMEVRRDAVRLLGTADEPRAARRRLVSEALLPVDDTAGWGAAGPGPAALSGVALMESANEREEGLAVATAMRAALGEPGATVALVTPDRALARRVICELRRFAVEADDSGGEDLAATPQGSFIPVIADVVLAEPDAARMLALLKHPLFRCGREGEAMRPLASLFELVVLRGRKGRLRPFDLTAETRAAVAFHRNPRNRGRRDAVLGDGREEALIDFAAAMDAVSAPLSGGAARPLSAWIATLAAAAEHFAKGPDGSFAPLYEGDAGGDLARMLVAVNAASAGFLLRACDVPPVLAALMEGRMVKPKPGGHARAFIWGTLEARLQQADIIILGGLNEGGWPPAPDAGPFLARPMRAAIGLEPPERRIGQSAHDFEQALGARHVILSRALKAGGEPKEPARWLQRLLAVAGPDGAAQMRAAGARTLAVARRLDLPEAAADPAPRPEPKPHRRLRPKDFSVTEIDTLRRDPYAIHARRILGLEPLADLTRAPDAAERGTLFHAILAEQVRLGLDPDRADAEDALLALARRHFDAEHLEPGIDAVWWPRFRAAVPAIIAFERERKAASAGRKAELASARLPVLGDFTLRARADRIDTLADGTVAVMDWKTGSSPSETAAKKLLSAQLALEAGLVARGAFHDGTPATVGKLAFLRLKDRGEFKVEAIAPRGEGSKDARLTITPQMMADEAWQRLVGLLKVFDDETHPYVSRANPLKRGKENREEDYDHLARFAEWSATGGEQVGDEDEHGDGEGEGGA